MITAFDTLVPGGWRTKEKKITIAVIENRIHKLVNTVNGRIEDTLLKSQFSC